ncbi:thioredoxin domain-containing protein [Rhodococcus sp. HNM0569]|uniref:thioredoxin domain-containing protein n=1 Tax=Rhodococcus sp. HNM0569 TaxID=2716340 RepID=UPI00146BE287|nr:thioredoxin domain-containing protein [Rhodococcus sp. HNM0569]NLU82780.1 thioredoxin domain-containing protein [Rhodococcus sp. HNM0569]
MNRLADSRSPYLLQHADNPVHWQEWGPDALASARERDVPILLSVGYAACHWCHVMAHESFEDDATAELMNANFVCVKVDREERPDLDAIYMTATVAMTGQGGWPMTCFLTPDGAPFYCGTYYPRIAHGGMPSFTQVLDAIVDTWRTRREDVTRAGDAVVTELTRSAGAVPAGGAPTADALDAAVASVLQDEDTAHGGFGGAPKFPPSALLEGLIRHTERTGSSDVHDAVERTASAMARGGIHDQLAGGFARYSVDAEWIVPHFEKMLYDNAQLLRVYAHLARRTSSPEYTRVAAGIVDFLLRDLRTETGAFASSLDADTEGVEGLTYVWTPEELVDVLGFDDGVWAAGLLGVGASGTFEAGTSVAQLLETPDDPARWARVREALFAYRLTRPQPARDDKVVTAWNGLAIGALAEAGAGLGEPEWVDAARAAAEAVVDLHVVDGRVRRASLGGEVGESAGVLEDYAALAAGLLALYQATGEGRWLQTACALLEAALEHFADAEAPGAWFDTADDAEVLVSRPRDPVDGATPSGASTIADALLTAAALATPDLSERYRIAADASLARAALLLERVPRSAGNWLAVAEAAVRGPLQVAVATDGATALLDAARRDAPGGTVVVGGVPDSAPLLVDRPLVDGQAAAYVCRGFVCERPVTDSAELAAALAR